MLCRVRVLRVLSASSAEEALAIQDEFDGNIDFLLTDIVLPNLSGIRLKGIIYGSTANDESFSNERISSPIH